MDPQLRAQFNADFTPEKYTALVRCVNETEKWPADFRISERPIRRFRATGHLRSAESKTRRILGCYDAQLSPIQLQKMSSYLRSSRKSKKHTSISPLRKPFLVFVRFA